MNIEEAIKILDYKINMYKEDVFIGDLDKTNIEAIKKVLKEIKRLNNNWNELEKWIEKERNKWEKYNPDSFVYYQSILDRMEELKGDDKNGNN